MKFRRLFAGLLTALAILAIPSSTPQAHASAGSWTLFNDSRTLILQGTIKTGDSFKLMLFASGHNVSTSSTTCTSGLTGEVSSTSTGYTTGGQAVTLSLSGTTSVVVYFSSQPSWTAGSANLAAQTGVLCDTTSGDGLAFFNLDSGASTVTTTSGQTLTISDISSNPVLTFA